MSSIYFWAAVATFLLFQAKVIMEFNGFPYKNYTESKTLCSSYACAFLKISEKLLNDLQAETGYVIDSCLHS